MDYFICFSTKFVHVHWCDFVREFNLREYDNPYTDPDTFCKLAKAGQVTLCGCTVIVQDELPPFPDQR